MAISVPGRSGREGRLIRCLRQARRDGRLPEQFRAADAWKACPEAAKSTFGTFLPKHRVGNPGGYSELFVRHDVSGLYSLIDE